MGRCRDLCINRGAKESSRRLLICFHRKRHHLLGGHGPEHHQQGQKRPDLEGGCGHQRHRPSGGHHRRLDSRSGHRTSKLTIDRPAVCLWLIFFLPFLSAASIGNIYWTDQGFDVIEVARLNGSFRYVVISQGLDKPRAITVHPAQG